MYSKSELLEMARIFDREGGYAVCDVSLNPNHRVKEACIDALRFMAENQGNDKTTP